MLSPLNFPPRDVGDDSPTQLLSRLIEFDTFSALRAVISVAHFSCLTRPVGKNGFSDDGTLWRKVPDDLLVAHAEKRVLRGALDEAGRQAADVEVRPLQERMVWNGMGWDGMG